MKREILSDKIKRKWHGVKPGWRSCAMIGISIFVLFLCITYWPLASKVLVALLGAATPVLIGFIIAYPLNILMSFYERYWFLKSTKKAVVKTRRPICLILAVITLLAIIALVIGLVLPQFIECIKLIINYIPAAASNVVGFLEKYDILTDKTVEYIKSIDWQAWIAKAISMVYSGISNVVEVVFVTITSVFSGIITALLSVIFACYFLMGKNRIGSQIDRAMKCYASDKWYKRIKYFVQVLDDSFHKYIVGQCVEAVILGVLCTVGMLILQLPYAPMVGALIALTALVPIAGAYIGAGVGAFLILMVSPVKAVIFIIFVIILQQIEGNLIYPKVVGSSIGLPGVWVLAAVTIGGGVMGIGGMLLGVPLAATLYKIIRNDVNNRFNVSSEITEGDAENADQISAEDAKTEKVDGKK